LIKENGSGQAGLKVQRAGPGRAAYCWPTQGHIIEI